MNQEVDILALARQFATPEAKDSMQKTVTPTEQFKNAVYRALVAENGPTSELLKFYDQGWNAFICGEPCDKDGSEDYAKGWKDCSEIEPSKRLKMKITMTDGGMDISYIARVPDMLELKNIIIERGSNVFLATNIPNVTGTKVTVTIRGVGLIGVETVIHTNSWMPMPDYLELEDLGRIRTVNVQWRAGDTAHTAIGRYNDRATNHMQVRFFSSIHHPQTGK